MDETDQRLPSDFEDPNDYYVLVTAQIAEDLQQRGFNVDAVNAARQRSR